MPGYALSKWWAVIAVKEGKKREREHEHGRDTRKEPRAGQTLMQQEQWTLKTHKM